MLTGLTVLIVSLCVYTSSQYVVQFIYLLICMRPSSFILYWVNNILLSGSMPLLTAIYIILKFSFFFYLKLFIYFTLQHCIGFAIY